MSENQAKWYVVHTYSGYENKVKANIEKLENRGMQDIIQQVSVPLMDEVEVRNGQKKLVQHKIFPGYVLIKMIMTDESWYVVRNTRGVTSFVGPGSDPTPLTEKEVYDMGIDEFTYEDFGYEVGDTVLIKDGSFKDSTGTVREINVKKRTVNVGISMFGRETPLELNFDEVQRL